MKHALHLSVLSQGWELLVHIPQFLPPNWQRSQHRFPFSLNCRVSLVFLTTSGTSCLPDFFSLLFFLNNMFLTWWESFLFNFRLINSNYLGLVMSSSGPSAHQHIIFDLSCEELMCHGEIFSWGTGVVCMMECFSSHNYTSQQPLPRWEFRLLMEAPGTLLFLFLLSSACHCVLPWF